MQLSTLRRTSKMPTFNLKKSIKWLCTHFTRTQFMFLYAQVSVVLSTKFFTTFYPFLSRCAQPAVDAECVHTVFDLKNHALLSRACRLPEVVSTGTF